MTRRQRAAERLCVGSAEVWRRLTARAVAWVRKGPGRPQRIVRLLMLLAGLYLAARVVRAMPNLMWLLTSWWVVASWRAGKSAPPQAAEAPATDRDVLVLRQLLLDLMGAGSGVHLRTVLAHLQQHGQWEGRTVTDLRVHLERLGIPVHPKVKVAGTPTRGVRREDLQAPSVAAGQEASPASSPAA